MNKNITRIFIATILILLVFAIIALATKNKNAANNVTNFEQCMAADYPVSKSYPPQCTTPLGQTFTQNIPSKNQLDDTDSSQITNFEECAAAGHPVVESFPEQCKTPDGRSFARELRPEEKEQLVPPKQTIPDDGSLCKNTCGNGNCEEIVCMGTGCPCPESTSSCPADCGSQKDRDIPSDWEPY